MPNRLRDLGVRCQHPECVSGQPIARYRVRKMLICKSCYDRERANDEDPLLAWLVRRGTSRAADAAAVLRILREKLGSDATQAEFLEHARALGHAKFSLLARGLAELLRAGVVVRGLVVRPACARTALGLKPKRTKRADPTQDGTLDPSPACTKAADSCTEPCMETPIKTRDLGMEVGENG